MSIFLGFHRKVYIGYGDRMIRDTMNYEMKKLYSKPQLVSYGSVNLITKECDEAGNCWSGVVPPPTN
jgi:hypothetical protein